MYTLSRTKTLVVLLAIASVSYSQDLKKDGVLKHADDRVAAVMTFAPGGSIVVAYVASGSEGEKLNRIFWSEVRLLDVASGKHRVLVRAATPAALTGIGANHTLRGFTVDGKKLIVSTSDPGGTIRELQLDVAEPTKDAPKAAVNPQQPR